MLAVEHFKANYWGNYLYLLLVMLVYYFKMFTFSYNGMCARMFCLNCIISVGLSFLVSVAFPCCQYSLSVITDIFIHIGGIKRNKLISELSAFQGHSRHTCY